jgi:hypothetical protein
MSLLSSYLVSYGEGDLGTYKPAKHTDCQLNRVCRVEVTHLH